MDETQIRIVIVLVMFGIAVLVLGVMALVAFLRKTIPLGFSRWDAGRYVAPEDARAFNKAHGVYFLILCAFFAICGLVIAVYPALFIGTPATLFIMLGALAFWVVAMWRIRKKYITIGSKIDRLM